VRRHRLGAALAFKKRLGLLLDFLRRKKSRRKTLEPHPASGLASLILISRRFLDYHKHGVPQITHNKKIKFCIILTKSIGKM
jgi:hypothetical protein